MSKKCKKSKAQKTYSYLAFEMVNNIPMELGFTSMLEDAKRICKSRVKHECYIRRYSNGKIDGLMAYDSTTFEVTLL